MLMGRSTPWSSSGTFRPGVLMLTLPGLEAEDLEGEDMLDFERGILSGGEGGIVDGRGMKGRRWGSKKDDGLVLCLWWEWEFVDTCKYLGT